MLRVTLNPTDEEAVQAVRRFRTIKQYDLPQRRYTTITLLSWWQRLQFTCRREAAAAGSLV